MADDDSLGGRVKPYAKVGTTIGRFAARMAGGRPVAITRYRAENAT